VPGNPSADRTDGVPAADAHGPSHEAAPQASPAGDGSEADAALAAIFGSGGLLSRSLPGFRFRSQQLAMAQSVARANAPRGQRGGGARTGTRKSFAVIGTAQL
jgi:hypothetical protein